MQSVDPKTNEFKPELTATKQPNVPQTIAKTTVSENISKVPTTLGLINAQNMKSTHFSESTIETSASEGICSISHTLTTEALSKMDLNDGSAQDRKICNSALDVHPIKNGNQNGKITRIGTMKNNTKINNLSRGDRFPSIEDKTCVSKDTSEAQEIPICVPVDPVEDNLAEVSRASSIFSAFTSEKDVIKIIDVLRCWSANEHSQFLRLFSIHGLDFQKIAESMINRDFAQVRAYACYSFTGESLAHWSIEEYESFLENVPMSWIHTNWSKTEVIDKIRKKSDLKANGTLTAGKTSFSDKKDSNDEKYYSESVHDLINVSSVNSTVTGEDYGKPQSNHCRSIEIKRNDVLSFKGSGKFGLELIHPGNMHFQKILSLRKKEYTKCSSKVKDALKKRGIVIGIIDSIKCLDPPGRFLKFNRRGVCSRMSDDEVFIKTRNRIHIAKPLSVVTDGLQSGVSSAKKVPTVKTGKTTNNRCMLELASFNPPPLNQDDGILDRGKRSRRQRQTVSFFEPGDTASKTGTISKRSRADGKGGDVNGDDGDNEGQNLSSPRSTSTSRKRKRDEDVENTVPSTMELRSRTTTNSTMATSTSTSLRSSPPKQRSPTKQIEEKPRKVIRRLSRKASRRVATNALIGFLQRNQTSSSDRNRETRRYPPSRR